MQALSFLPDTFTEYEELQAILDVGSGSFEIHSVCEAQVRGRTFAVQTASIGSRDPRAPAIGRLMTSPAANSEGLLEFETGTSIVAGPVSAIELAVPPIVHG